MSNEMALPVGGVLALSGRSDCRAHDACASGAKSAGNSSNLKVLIADDSPVYREIVEKALAAIPFQVILASTGRQAIQLFAEHKPDVVVLDRVMADLTGPAVCRKLREMEPDLHPYIVMLTGSTDKESVIEAFEAGADDYVTKPFHDAELAARVGVGLRYRELYREIGAKNQLLEELALSDPLTGLPNRRAIETWAVRELEGAARYGFPIWVVMADLDRFKNVNDVFGHAAGDAVLKEFSRILKANTRSSEMCGRLGGEEFVVIMTHTSREGALAAVERTRAQLERTPFTFSGCSLLVTASFGVAGFENKSDPLTLGELLSSADQALYSAKRRGRNRCEIADSSTQPDTGQGRLRAVRK